MCDNDSTRKENFYVEALKVLFAELTKWLALSNQIE